MENLLSTLEEILMTSHCQMSRQLALKALRENNPEKYPVEEYGE